MENCSMKRGFFFLRPCDHPARRQCTICGKPFCEEHLRIRPGRNEPACLDCLGKELQKPNRGSDYEDDLFDPGWSYGYRRNFYSGSHYRPWYIGQANADTSFDGHEVRVFDSESADDFDDDPNAEADGFDS